MHQINLYNQFIAASLGGICLSGFAQRPAEGTRGGILLLWDQGLLEVSDIATSSYCLSATVRIRDTGATFKTTSVYGPTDSACKDAFFAERNFWLEMVLQPNFGKMHD